MINQQREIERHLRDLGPSGAPSVVPSDEEVPRAAGKPVRRAYPKVMPNYINLDDPSETWSGRENRPRWLSAQIAKGKTLQQFLIPRKVGKRGVK